MEKKTFADAALIIARGIADEEGYFTRKGMNEHIEEIVRMTGSQGKTPSETLSNARNVLIKQGLISRVSPGKFLLLEKQKVSLPPPPAKVRSSKKPLPVMTLNELLNSLQLQARGSFDEPLFSGARLAKVIELDKKEMEALVKARIAKELYLFRGSNLFLYERAVYELLAKSTSEKTRPYRNLLFHHLQERRLEDDRTTLNLTPSGRKRSQGEQLVHDYLRELGLYFQEEQTFPDCRHKGLLRFDFYLPEKNLCIEYDGKQHFQPVSHFGGEEAFQETKLRDDIKNKYCQAKGLQLVRIKYVESREQIHGYLKKVLG